MSEYQYYEFQAVDRPLTPAEMAELRKLMTRATIAPTLLRDVYHWGDFKGDSLALMERHFDGHVYVANWGTHQVMLRLPRRLLDPRIARQYAVRGCLEVHVRGDNVILELTSEDDQGGDWGEEEDGDEGWLPALLPLRQELAAGDRRALYLAWLAGAQAGELDDNAREPPVPSGLGDLSVVQQALVEFLRIDADLLAIAAAASAAPPSPTSAADVGQWIAGRPVDEKDAWLTRVALGEGAAVAAELRHHVAGLAAARPDVEGERTVGELRAAAAARAAERRRREAQRRAAERARRQQEEAAARARYLDGLVGRADELWARVDALVETKRPKEYDQAVGLVRDLRDLAARGDGAETFTASLARLRQRCAKRPSLLERLDRAGLTA